MQLHETDQGAGDDRVGFEVGERARARGLLDLLAGARADIDQGVDATLIAKQRTLKQRLNAKDAARREMLNGPTNAAQAASLAKEIDSLIAEVQLVDSQIRSA